MTNSVGLKQQACTHTESQQCWLGAVETAWRSHDAHDSSSRWVGERRLSCGRRHACVNADRYAHAFGRLARGRVGAASGSADKLSGVQSAL